MSLNRTLSRLFDEVRREARRNQAFADRLDAVIRAHQSFRELPLFIDPDAEEESSVVAPETASARHDAPQKPPHDPGPNPVALFTRGGAAAVESVLGAEEWSLSALQALVTEHNLDPAGVAAGLEKPALIAHVVAQAQKRIERDRKLFDY